MEDYDGPGRPRMFRRMDTLSVWSACWLETHCGCRGTTLIPVKLLANRIGEDITFEALLRRLKCEKCGQHPSPVYLCAGHREHCGGAPPDWAVEIVPAGRGRLVSREEIEKIMPKRISG